MNGSTLNVKKNKTKNKPLHGTDLYFNHDRCDYGHVLSVCWSGNCSLSGKSKPAESQTVLNK